ncbi:MAG: type II toxin-antitoxin system RelE/ParE family toxin [Tissierellaceae bacterium]|nr:type II toxin-antitoxin system RelE/ParE family toxin [Tissierellaceae bacterium]
MAGIEYSPQALIDLQRLREYISTNWGEDVAKRILTKITSDIRKLEQYPVSGVDLGRIIDITTDYRYLYSEKNYVFYYLDFDRVRIVRIINEKQDYIQQLFGSSSKFDE